jgi:hypothetical protein
VSQNQFTIENNAKNAAVFDTDNPNSFMSFLKFNSGYLSEFDTRGISEETLYSLSTEDKESLVMYIGSPGVRPLIDDDPNSSNFGENLVTIDENGFEAYVYDAPDTLWTDYNGISQITFDYADGKGSVWDRIDRVTFSKKYNNKLCKVLSLSRKGFLSFDGFSYLYPLKTDINKVLTDSSNPDSFWSVLRNESMTNYELKKKGQSVVSRKFNMYMFPGDGLRIGYYNYEYGPIYWYINGGTRKFSAFEDGIYLSEQKPFSLNLAAELDRDSTAREENHLLFDNVYMLYLSGSVPLIEEDPNSPDFGENLIKTNALGEQEFVYDEPMPTYYWIDYSDVVIYASQNFHTEKESGVIKPYMKDLYFTKEIEGQHQLVSHIEYSEEVDKYFESHLPPRLQDFEWYQIFKTASKDKEKHSINKQ